MPVATVLGHHPAYHMGACYSGPFEVSEYDVIGGYLGEPLRLVASETFGDDLLIPADAEVVIEGVLKPGGRVVEGPFGEAPGYLGRSATPLACIRSARHQLPQRRHVPVGDHAGRRQAVDGSAARRRLFAPLPRGRAGRHRCLAQGRHALNVFISMKKLSEGDPGRAAAAALTLDRAKNVFVFDDDIDVFNPTEILWAIATRVQPYSADFNHLKTSCGATSSIRP